MPAALEDVLAVVGGPSRALGGSGRALGGSGRALGGSGRALGGSGRAALGRLAPDVQAWLASPEQSLSAAIESASGAQAATEALARLGPSRLEVISIVDSDRACWAEIARHGDGEAETCVAGLAYGPDGEVSRLVWLRAPLVPARDSGAADPAPDGRPILEAYFADLMSSRFREAAAHFTADTIYSHPPYGGGKRWVLFDGREALWRGFAVERGPSPAQQIITDLWQQGDRVFVEGVIEGIPNGGTFFSTAQINAGGEIARYAAFYSATRIPS
jgi:hypothetical protein